MRISPFYHLLIKDTYLGAAKLIAMIRTQVHNFIHSYHIHNTYQYISPKIYCQFIYLSCPSIHPPNPPLTPKHPHRHTQQLIGGPIQLNAEHRTDTCTCGGPTSTVPSPTMNTKLPSIPANLHTPSSALTLMWEMLNPVSARCDGQWSDSHV